MLTCWGFSQGWTPFPGVYSREQDLKFVKRKNDHKVIQWSCFWEQGASHSKQGQRNLQQDCSSVPAHIATPCCDVTTCDVTGGHAPWT